MINNDCKHIRLPHGVPKMLPDHFFLSFSLFVFCSQNELVDLQLSKQKKMNRKTSD